MTRNNVAIAVTAVCLAWIMGGCAGGLAPAPSANRVPVSKKPPK